MDHERIDLDLVGTVAKDTSALNVHRKNGFK